MLDVLFGKRLDGREYALELKDALTEYYRVGDAYERTDGWSWRELQELARELERVENKLGSFRPKDSRYKALHSALRRMLETQSANSKDEVSFLRHPARNADAFVRLNSNISVYRAQGMAFLVEFAKLGEQEGRRLVGELYDARFARDIEYLRGVA